MKRLVVILLVIVLVPVAHAQQPSSVPLEDVAAYVGLDRWYAQGFSGEGIKVGVIDVGFLGIDDLGVTYSIPDGMDISRSFAAYGQHGTQVIEVISGLVPNAEFYLYQLNLSQDDLFVAVDWMIEQGVDVVNYSVSTYDVPLDGTNNQSRQIDRLGYADIVAVVSAGNDALSYITDTYRDTDGDGWHEFEWGYENLWGAPYFTAAFSQSHLRWVDVYTNAQIDLDLYVWGDDGRTVLDASTRVQSGRSADWPYEDTFYPVTGGVPIYLGIRAKHPGTIPEGTVFFLYVEDTALGTITETGSISPPADSALALTVGALEPNEAIWPRSGRGPTWDGRIKPDLVAPSRLQLDSGLFLGTSAGTPVVTAIVAVLREAFPDWTELEVRNWLINNAVDLGVTGADNTFGYGRVWMPPVN